MGRGVLGGGGGRRGGLVVPAHASVLAPAGLGLYLAHDENQIKVKKYCIILPPDVFSDAQVCQISSHITKFRQV